MYVAISLKLGSPYGIVVVVSAWDCAKHCRSKHPLNTCCCTYEALACFVCVTFVGTVYIDWQPSARSGKRSRDAREICDCHPGTLTQWLVRVVRVCVQ